MTVSAEQLYEERMDLLSPQERMARCVALLKWTRDLLARQIKEELGEIEPERLKWEVALRMYGADPLARVAIERRLADVSG